MIDKHSWIPADGLRLEPNAMSAAIEKTQCLALTAGPGAGKTEMLAQRADFLLRTATCRYPKRILAISFKVDASRNLKDRVQRRCGMELSSRFDSYTFHAFAKRIVDRFRPILTGADALDPGYSIGDRRFESSQIQFSDLVPYAIQILTQSELARNAVRQTYTDVFLDEFQDCTSHQYQLIKVAFEGTNIRLTAVGDTKQKIMGWAGALDGIFHSFAADFNATALNMYRNFRSKPRLLRLQNEIIRVLDPSAVMSDEQIDGNEGEVTKLTFPDSSVEAELIADQITNWIEKEGVPPSEIAVLVSKQVNLYSAELMDSLSKRGISYRNEQELQDFSAEPVAQLIVDYLCCLYGKSEPKSWERIVNLLTPYAEEDIQFNAKLDIHDFVKKQRQSTARGRDTSVWNNAIEGFLDYLGEETLVALSPDYESRDRLKEVIERTKKYIIDQMKEYGNDLLHALTNFSDDSSVRILTIHKSKGLEFDSVIIMAVDNEIFWGDLDENRCAFFVGVSRAKKRLILTYAETRYRPSGYSKRWSRIRSVQDEFFGYADLVN